MAEHTVMHTTHTEWNSQGQDSIQKKAILHVLKTSGVKIYFNIVTSIFSSKLEDSQIGKWEPFL